ncbi:hypothetical protein J8I29_08570 [Labrys sp. LIt4]|uniref:hypothetical protein n=1 Tax=Labrys sp. LIt4 TaxID=2821355 RepID=UPI001AE05DD0|nr:hypothetical protein [Labrys sp. LIt4]MBP0579356.1 hypothetical protein [Labrys sp. LIt4]
MTKRPVILAPIMVTTGLTSLDCRRKSPREQGSARQQKSRPEERGGGAISLHYDVVEKNLFLHLGE